MFIVITILVAILLIAGTILIVQGMGEVQSEHGQTVVQKISRRRKRSTYDEGLTDQEREFARREEARILAERKNSLPTVSSYIKRNTLLNKLDEDLAQARSRWSAAELIAASLVLGIAVCFVFYWMGLGIVSIVAGVICLFLPWYYVKYQRHKYYQHFEEQLSDTLLLMANGLRSGFSFLQSMEMVSRESPPPMSDEFSRVIQEISIGVPINDALQNMANRVDSMDLNLVITAVVIQREVGGGLAEILETIAVVIAERLRIKREIQVLTTQGRMSGAILALLPLFIGILIHFSSKMGAPNDPSFIQPLLHDTRGQIMLVMAIISQLIGFFFIMRIVSIKV